MGRPEQLANQVALAMQNPLMQRSGQARARVQLYLQRLPSEAIANLEATLPWLATVGTRQSVQEITSTVPTGALLLWPA
jgi:hypothetical protein